MRKFKLKFRGYFQHILSTAAHWGSQRPEIVLRLIELYFIQTMKLDWAACKKFHFPALPFSYFRHKRRNVPDTNILVQADVYYR